MNDVVGDIWALEIKKESEKFLLENGGMIIRVKIMVEDPR